MFQINTNVLMEWIKFSVQQLMKGHGERGTGCPTHNDIRDKITNNNNIIYK